MTDVTWIEQASARTIADWIGERLANALDAAQGRVAIAVPGGSTPFPIFAELVQTEIDFSRLVVWPGDDRIVPEDHPASNTGKIRAIFEPVGAAVETLQESSVPPRFALCWLGMGGDGHIASLFPNTDPQVSDPQRVRRLVPDPLPPEAPFARLSMTIPALLDAEALMFVIRGADKRAVFDDALAGKHDLPVARLLRAVRQPVTVFT
jgi:6-phosphogluconolactonase